MKLALSLFMLLGAMTSAAHAQQEKVIVFPVEAIADSAKLTKEQLYERYVGIDATQFGLADEGWYVRYDHELLTYIYGPIDDLKYARRQKQLLEEIRLSAVLKNPKLSSSKISLIRFDFNAAPGTLGVDQIEDNPYLVPELQEDQENSE